jgi:hypothetical protein
VSFELTIFPKTNTTKEQLLTFLRKTTFARKSTFERIVFGKQFWPVYCLPRNQQRNSKSITKKKKEQTTWGMIT